MRLNTAFPAILTLIAIIALPTGAAAGDRLFVKSAEKEVRLTGYTRCLKSVTLTSEVSGTAVKVNYAIGDTLKDSPFVQIDRTFINYRISQDMLKIKQIDSKIKSLTAAAAYLKKNRQRIKALKKNQHVTESSYEEATEKLYKAIKELEALKIEKAMISLSKKKLEEERSRHNIHGFKGGVVTACHIEKGEYVQAGSPLAEIADYSTLVVPLSLSGNELKAVRALPKKFPAMVESTPVTASIHFINPKFDETTRKSGLEIKLIGYTGEKRGGLSFSTSIRVKTDGVLIPREAVRNRFGNPEVVLKATGEAIPVVIIDESGKALIVAATDKLAPGTELRAGGSSTVGG